MYIWWGQLLKVVIIAVVTAVIDYALNQKESVGRRLAWF